MTNSPTAVRDAFLPSFDRRTDHRLLFRRLGVCANEIVPDTTGVQLDLFTDYKALERERKIREALAETREKYGPNAVFKGTNMLEGATALERNGQIGGHRA